MMYNLYYVNFFEVLIHSTLQWLWQFKTNGITYPPHKFPSFSTTFCSSHSSPFFFTIINGSVNIGFVSLLFIPLFDSNIINI